MPKSKEPKAPARPQADASTPAELTPAERARAIIEQRLAQKKHGPPHLNGKAGGVHKPGKGGWSPPPIRPGGRGRRG
ncbi:MAG: hypothetical protein ACK41C_11725 [Phenylobacterium sp.]|uniref:hypothetical protein n=1 Tax=Phenylobacterium sp. TaxID=1871053 RepID=UPI00391B99A4